MKRHLTCATVVVAALGMFGGCSDDEVETVFPTGMFVPVSATSTDDGYIEYKSDGTYLGTYVAQTGPSAWIATAGTYTTDGDEITVDDIHCEFVRPDSNPVTYTFEWDGELLSFGDNPDDTCTNRAATYSVDLKLAAD
jgi:hypothetical protein